jgi:hypothetical protein
LCPVCLAGERNCPLEDVGGVAGYAEFLEVIFERGYEEHEHYVCWARGPSLLNRSVGRFQPEEFDVMAVNDAPLADAIACSASAIDASRVGIESLLFRNPARAIRSTCEDNTVSWSS